MDIELISEKPIKTKQYRMSPRHINVLKEEIKRLLDLGVIEGLESFALPYIDGIAIFSRNWKEHVKHIHLVLGRLKAAGLKVKPSKCRFAQEEVLFLGHTVGSGSRSPRIVGYYAHYIPNYSEIASPLSDALRGKTKRERITWDERCEKAFVKLKGKLVSKPILFAPDFSKDFILQTDASDIGAGVVLSQKINGE
ncbi:retrovirus-related Pol polyprotein from transposon 297 [Trichonephila clavipes]|nr:retrovirus-related Pol polyprotein from transposon 297 [Trichonephila clavipes]